MYIFHELSEGLGDNYLDIQSGKYILEQRVLFYIDEIVRRF